MRDWLTILKWSASEDRQKQAEHDAEDDAGNNGEIKCRMFALNANVAGQPSKPFRRKPAPHRQAHQRGDYTNDDDEFPQLAHSFKKLRESREGTSLRTNARTIPRLLRNTRRAEDRQ